MASQDQFETAPNDLDKTVKDLVSGAAGGIAQVLSGQPFDIIKVRLQTSQQYFGALDTARQILTKEGPLAFYKGTLTPLIGIGACVSVQFGAFNYAKRVFENANCKLYGRGKEGLMYGQYYLAGAFAGIANSPLSSPIEHIRIRLQTQPHHTRLYTGPWDCVKKLSRSSGVLRGVYRGTSVTVLREAQAYGTWFLTFEYLMEADRERNGGYDRKEIDSWKVATYGGLAGEALWLASYPLDVVKSKMQTDILPGTGNGPRFKSARECFAQTWRTEGIRGFWKGIGPTLLRAMPVSAITFATVETTMRLIS